MERDPRIDQYIEDAAPFAQPILRRLRDLVHAAVPGLGETLKWGMPHFTHKGKNLAGFAAFKAHAAFMIHGDGHQGDGMGQFGKIATLSDLPPDNVLKARLIDARDRIALTIAGAGFGKTIGRRLAHAREPTGVASGGIRARTLGWEAARTRGGSPLANSELETRSSTTE